MTTCDERKPSLRNSMGNTRPLYLIIQTIPRPVERLRTIALCTILGLRKCMVPPTESSSATTFGPVVLLRHTYRGIGIVIIIIIIAIQHARRAHDCSTTRSTEIRHATRRSEVTTSCVIRVDLAVGIIDELD